MSEEQEAEGAARGRVIIAWVVAPLVCIAFFPTILLLLIGMAPSIVAYIVDKRPRKITTRSIGYLNFAGCLYYALKLWMEQNTISGVLELVSEPSTLMIMYSSAAVGWMLNFIMVPIMSAFLAVQHEAKIRSISRRQEDLIKEWGSVVKGQVILEEIPAQELREPVDSAAQGGAFDKGRSGSEVEDEPEENSTPS